MRLLSFARFVIDLVEKRWRSLYRDLITHPSHYMCVNCRKDAAHHIVNTLTFILNENHMAEALTAMHKNYVPDYPVCIDVTLIDFIALLLSCQMEKEHIVCYILSFFFSNKICMRVFLPLLQFFASMSPFDCRLLW